MSDHVGMGLYCVISPRLRGTIHGIAGPKCLVVAITPCALTLTSKDKHDKMEMIVIWRFFHYVGVLLFHRTDRVL